MGQLDGRAFVVAAPAETGNLRNRGRRLGIGRTKNVVRAVAIRAFGSEFVAALGGLPMQALCMLLLLGGVTVAAIDALKFFRMREFFFRQIVVATDTLQAGVG